MRDVRTMRPMRDVVRVLEAVQLARPRDDRTGEMVTPDGSAAAAVPVAVQGCQERGGIDAGAEDCFEEPEGEAVHGQIRTMCDAGVSVGGVDEDLFEVVEPWDAEEVDELRANPAQRGEVGGFIFR